MTDSDNTVPADKTEKSRVREALAAIRELNGKLSAAFDEDYRTPPGQLATNQFVATKSWCSYSPLLCLAQVMTEALFVVAAYATIVTCLGGTSPPLSNIGMFLMLFCFVTYAARMVSDSISDKITVTIISALGSKIFSTLNSKVVGW